MYSLTASGKKALKKIRKIYEAVLTEECKLAFD